MKEIRAKRAFLKAENAKYPAHLESVPEYAWPNKHRAENLRYFWRSRDFCVQGFHEKAGWIRLSVCRCALKSNGDWEEGISWDQLQRLKRECGFGDRDAFEIYPADGNVVNVANMRHLWISPEPLTQTWRSGK